jgi:pyrimidine operon attenuation protein / uracil phosphoribosyltransferase
VKGAAGSNPAQPPAAEPAAAPPAEPGRILLDGSDVARIVDRIAHQILEKTGGAGAAVLLGIPTRGAPLARRLADRIRAFESVDVPVGVLDVTLYRDDLRLRGVRPLAATREPAGGVDGKVVILTDDVLYSGRTVRAALDALRDLGRPRAVQLAVLVDRGHRELPIRADYVGKNLPTSREETVHVQLVETDGRDGVLLDSAGPPGWAPASRPEGASR